MATIKEFLTRVKAIDGVSGCLLVSNDGRLHGHLLDIPDKYSPLMTLSTKYAHEVMHAAGFTHCRFVSFERTKGHNFHIFPMGKYYLGIVQEFDFPRDKMIKKVSHLLSLVKTSSSSDNKNHAGTKDREGSGL